jgi:hypothetical protein
LVGRIVDDKPVQRSLGRSDLADLFGDTGFPELPSLKLNSMHSDSKVEAGSRIDSSVPDALREPLGKTETAMSEIPIYEIPAAKNVHCSSLSGVSQLSCSTNSCNENKLSDDCLASLLQDLSPEWITHIESLELLLCLDHDEQLSGSRRTEALVLC